MSFSYKAINEVLTTYLVFLQENCVVTFCFPALTKHRGRYMVTVCKWKTPDVYYVGYRPNCDHPNTLTIIQKVRKNSWEVPLQDIFQVKALRKYFFLTCKINFLLSVNKVQRCSTSSPTPKTTESLHGMKNVWMLRDESFSVGYDPSSCVRLYKHPGFSHASLWQWQLKARLEAKHDNFLTNYSNYLQFYFLNAYCD